MVEESKVAAAQAAPNNEEEEKKGEEEEDEVADLKQMILDMYKAMQAQAGKRRVAAPAAKKNRPVVTNIGKALSLEVATRMIEHKDINTVMSKQARLKAVGSVDDFPRDVMTTYLTKYCEEIFEPKRVLTDGDWLKRYREPDQRFEYYQRGNGNIQWVGPNKNKIYLFIADPDSFTEDQLAKFKLYCSAFYHGIAGVEILKAGSKIPGKGDKKVPANFLESEIESREGFEAKQYRCRGKDGILMKMPKYRPSDNYAMLLCTMKDLYPQPSWAFCFGWATYDGGVGCVSFARYDPAWDGIEDPDSEKTLLMHACHIMCHEIGHQFGLRHCIYYECLMNGVMSADEQRRGGIKLLCPVCHKKLQQNIKFDSTERFQKLAAACK